MQSHNFLKHREYLESVSKLLSLLFKLSIFMGSVCFLIYCIRIDYFPLGLSIADSILLIMSAASFGLVYLFFIATLTSFGIVVCWLISKPIFIAYKLIKKNRITFQILKPNFAIFILCIFGLFLGMLIARTNLLSYLSLIVTSLLSALSITSYFNLEYRGKIVHPKSFVIPTKHNKLHIIFILTIVIFVGPLFISGASGRLLESGMKLINLKKGLSYVCLRSPYSEFIPKELKSSKLQITGYTTFENIDVLLSGLGHKTVIRFPINESGTERFKIFEIPNDQIIIFPE